MVAAGRGEEPVLDSARCRRGQIVGGAGIGRRAGPGRASRWGCGESAARTHIERSDSSTVTSFSLVTPSHPLILLLAAHGGGAGDAFMPPSESGLPLAAVNSRSRLIADRTSSPYLGYLNVNPTCRFVHIGRVLPCPSDEDAVLQVVFHRAVGRVGVVIVH